MSGGEGRTAARQNVLVTTDYRNVHRRWTAVDENSETCCIVTLHQLFEYSTDMETIITIHIEKLPEGVYLATSDTLQGLVAQGRTISETLEIARDVAKMLLEAGQEPEKELLFVEESFDYPLIVGL